MEVRVLSTAPKFRQRRNFALSVAEGLLSYGFSELSISTQQKSSPERAKRSEALLSLFPPGWHTYMLICIDGSYYVGMTNDLNQRIQDHAKGKGPTYTKLSKPKLLVWYESHSARESAALA